MIIGKLSVLNYKNIRHAEIVCSVKTNCFFGNNGMGKTNLLDAIYYLSFCKSHIHTPDNRIVLNGEELCVIQGIYDYDGKEEEIFCAIRNGQRKQFKRNMKEYERLSEHIGLLPLVMISPADSELIHGGSEERRRFMDMIISQHDKPYLNALIHYNKALLQRNVLLKNQSHDDSLYEALEMQMDVYGRLIFEKRIMLIDQLIPLFNEYHQYICGSGESVNLCYDSQLAIEDLASALRDSRTKDLYIGYTSTGIHKDDIEMTLDRQLIRRIGYQGQNKTYLIALKLAQFAYIASKGMTKPILLLDDIFDKLDAGRVEKIIGLVSGDRFGQIFITDTNRNYLDRILEAIDQDYSLFRVEHGEVSVVSSLL
jgi:DNA replication and repair protein RecF